jgi:hypothetical protein
MEASLQKHRPRHSQALDSPAGRDRALSPILTPPASARSQPSFFSSRPTSREISAADLNASMNRGQGSFNPMDFKYPTFSAATGSPSSIAGSSLHEPHDHYMPPSIAGGHITGPGLSAPKRAYRQRRKDPSCDACRERKVKVSNQLLIVLAK